MGIRGYDFIGIIILGALWLMCRKAWKEGYKEGYKAAKREYGDKNECEY